MVCQSYCFSDLNCCKILACGKLSFIFQDCWKDLFQKVRYGQAMRKANNCDKVSWWEKQPLCFPSVFGKDAWKAAKQHCPGHATASAWAGPGVAKHQPMALNISFAGALNPNSSSKSSRGARISAQPPVPLLSSTPAPCRPGWLLLQLPVVPVWCLHDLGSLPGSQWLGAVQQPHSSTVVLCSMQVLGHSTTMTLLADHLMCLVVEMMWTQWN